MAIYPALYKQCVISWHDSQQEAEAAVAEVRGFEQAEEDDFLTWLNQPSE